MKLRSSIPALDAVLTAHAEALGDDFIAYRNHCYRVTNLCLALHADAAPDAVAIAAGCHDLGIWTHRTFDYLTPSEQLARDYLEAHGQTALAPTVTAMIRDHHKLLPYRGDATVEAFRRADWIDVSRGLLRFGLPRRDLRALASAFPNAGFHRRLLQLSARRLRSHPLSPLPMLRL